MLSILCFSGCVANQEKLNETLQSHGAKLLRRDFQKISEYLYTYKEKLDLRNPKAFSPKARYPILQEIKNAQDSLRVTYNDVKLRTYDDYLRVAFNTSSVTERNDFLILGLHKLFYATYEIEQGHRITTLSYQQEAFKKLYYYLEVIKWKIRTTKDLYGNYLFITWQNNWQIELAYLMKKEATPSWDSIMRLPSLKSGKESLLDHSNPNFEILLNHMIAHTKNSARLVGDEPVDIGIDAMISIVLFL